MTDEAKLCSPIGSTFAVLVAQLAYQPIRGSNNYKCQGREKEKKNGNLVKVEENPLC